MMQRQIQKTRDVTLGCIPIYCGNSHRSSSIVMSEEVTKKKIELELEVGTTTVERGINPYQNWIHLAKAVDAWRIFPRVFLSVYIFLLYYSVMWFMDLKEPSLEQSGLISIIVGAGAAWFGLYAGTSNSSKNFKGED